MYSTYGGMALDPTRPIKTSITITTTNYYLQILNYSNIFQKLFNIQRKNETNRLKLFILGLDIRLVIA